MSNYRRYGRANGPRPPRWMPLQYAGTCSVCSKPIPVGVTAFYSPADKTVTCSEIPCAKARGLTKEVWHGSPVSGRYVDVLDERGYYFRDADPIRDPGEDAADRWNEACS